MIYCKLKGGLGNMLFQIAATISIAIDNSFDYSFINFKNNCNVLELINNRETKDYLQLFNTLNLCFDETNNHQLIEYPFNYKNIEIKDNVIIDGYFQSQKYFNHNRENILSKFNFSMLITEKLDYDFENKNYCSIHVRRGDYTILNNHYHQLDINYYKKAIEIMKTTSDIFLVFSDDIDYCKEIFNGIDNIFFVENKKDYVELYMMSLCKNNIIANSSFSWWGAWLNKNENKVVVAPEKWFGPEITEYSGDIIPEKWIKIE